MILESFLLKIPKIWEEIDQASAIADAGGIVARCLCEGCFSTDVLFR